MHKLQTAYTVYYNLRHRRAGHLMQGRFGAEPVAGDEYLLKLSRYIHLNPVFARGIKNLPLNDKIKHLRTYRWSSYRGYVGLAKPYGFVDEGPILRLTETQVKRQRRAYRSFVEAGVAETDDEFRELLKSSRWGIGDEAFQSRVQDLHADRTLAIRRPEDVSFRGMEPTLSAVIVLDSVAEVFGVEPAALRRRQYNCVARAAAAFMLGRYAGMNQRDIGVFLGMGTGSAVCRQLQRLRERQTQDGELNEQLNRIASTLQQSSVSTM
jgi:hypothetical protein